MRPAALLRADGTPARLLTVANVLLAFAVAAGCLLALWHLGVSGSTKRPPRWVGLAHGGIGAAGFVALLLSLGGAPRAEAEGAGQFGAIAAALFAMTLLTGGAILLRGRAAGVAMAAHAGIAVTGYVLFLTWSALG